MKQSEVQLGQMVKRMNYGHGDVKVGDIREIIEIFSDSVRLFEDGKYRHSPDNLKLVSQPLTQTTMEYLTKLTEDMVGKKVTCKIEGKPITDGAIQKKGEEYFICQNIKDGSSTSNKLGYKYSWSVENGSEDELRETNITELSLISTSEVAPIAIPVSVKETDIVKDEVYIYNETHIFVSERTGGDARASHYVAVKDKYYSTSSGISGGTYRLATRAEKMHLYACMDAKKYVDPPVVNKFIPGDKVIIIDDTGNYYTYFEKETVHGHTPDENQPGIVIKEKDKVCLVEYTRDLNGRVKTMKLGFHEDTLKHAEPVTLPVTIKDVTNTKIWVGKDSSLRIKVLQKLKELGCTNTEERDFKESVSFYIDSSKHTRHSTSDNSAKTKESAPFSENGDKKEIFPMDLGILPEGGLPDMDPDMLIQMIINS